MDKIMDELNNYGYIYGQSSSNMYDEKLNWTGGTLGDKVSENVKKYIFATLSEIFLDAVNSLTNFVFPQYQFK